MQNSKEVPPKTNKTTMPHSNFTSGYTTEENENINLKTYMYFNIHSSIIYNSQDMEAIQVSINRWLAKRCGLHTIKY